MSKSWNLRMGRIHLGGEAASSETADYTPFRILLMGDFSGRGSRGATAASLADRKPIVVDRDNFEDVLAKLAVEIHVPLAADAAGRVVVRIKELEDFHPDRLFEQLEMFESLRDVRRRLGNPQSFADAAEEVRHWAGARAESPSPALAAPPPSDPAALLAQMLGDSGLAPSLPSSRPEASDFNAFLRGVVGPHLVAADDPRQAQLEAAVDEAIGGTMRALLHHPAFQEVEAAWRALFLLIRRLETDETLKIFLLDVTRAELAADLTASDDLQMSRLYKLLVEQTVGTLGGKPWAVLAGHYTFAPTLADAQILQRLALLAQYAGAPFLAAAHPLLFGCLSLGEGLDPAEWKFQPDADTAAVWKVLRQFPEAQYLALAAPRLLLRHPYGSETSPTERFDFEELTDSPGHEEFLWGNPAFAVALLLGQTFSASGWSLRPGQINELDGLPTVTIRDDDEKKLKPCAEAVLSERGLERMLDAGVLPIVSIAESDRVRAVRFQAFASPPVGLPGRWNK